MKRKRFPVDVYMHDQIWPLLSTRNPSATICKIGQNFVTSPTPFFVGIVNE